MPHVNKKPLASEQIFVQTPFSHSTLKAKSSLQIDFKNHESEQILKTAPQFNSLKKERA